MKKSLLIVDYQKDFVTDDGALTVGKPAQDICANIENLANTYNEEDIFFTMDGHMLKDWEEKIFPETKIFNEHCIKGTVGYEIYGNIKGKSNISNHIEKNAYCPFKDFLLKMVNHYDEITIVGVVTDICVFQTTIGLYTTAVNNGISVDLVVDSSACASFNPEREKWALEYLKDVLQVTVN